MSFWNTIVGKIVKTAANVVLPVVGTITGIGAITAISKGIGAIAGSASNIVNGAPEANNAVNNGGMSALATKTTTVYNTQNGTVATTQQTGTAIEPILKPALIIGGAVAGLFILKKLLKK